MYFLEKQAPEISCLEGKRVLGVGNSLWWAVRPFVLPFFFLFRYSTLLCAHYLFNHYNNFQKHWFLNEISTNLLTKKLCHSVRLGTSRSTFNCVT